MKPLARYSSTSSYLGNIIRKRRKLKKAVISGPPATDIDRYKFQKLEETGKTYNIDVFIKERDFERDQKSCKTFHSIRWDILRPTRKKTECGELHPLNEPTCRKLYVHLFKKSLNF